MKSLSASVKFVRECVEAQKKLTKELESQSNKIKDSISIQASTRKVSQRRSNRVKIDELVPVQIQTVVAAKTETVDFRHELELQEVQFVDEGTRYSSDEDRSEEKPSLDITKSEKPEKIIVVHDKSYQCSYCERVFTNKFRLKNHLRIHTGERPYICQTCDKAFAQPNALKCHIRLHTGEKPYKCPVESCGKSFTQNTTLKTHMAALHIGKMVKCDKCDKTFTRASYLTAHQRLEHLGQRPYACHICPNRYKQKSHLDHHLEVHQGVKYACPICNRKYSKKWSLQIHSFTHLKEEDKDVKLPHACTECDESFARKDKLRAHVKTKHEGSGKKGAKVKVTATATAGQNDEVPVPVPSNVVEVESRPIILHESAIEGLKEFEGRQYHVINITEGAELIQEIVIPNAAIFYQEEFK